MGRWRAGGKLQRTLYRDDQLVGLVDTPEIAAEIVEALNLLAEVRPIDRSRQRAAESDRERSHEVITYTEHDRIEEQLRNRSHGTTLARTSGTGTCSTCSRRVPIDVVGGEYRLGFHEDSRTQSACRGTGSQA